MFMSISSKTRASLPVGSSLQFIINSKILEDFVESDDMGVWGETFKGLDLSQIVHLRVRNEDYLVDVIEVSFHAFNCNIFACFD